MSIPSREECLSLWDRYEVPGNIRQHMLVVTELALTLARKRKEAGDDVDLSLIEAMGLCHDLFKAATIDLRKTNIFNYTATPDEVSFWEALRERHSGKHEIRIFEDELGNTYPELALHLKKAEPHLFKDEVLIEVAIMKYADCRVMGDTIVTLDERVDDLKERYDYFAKNEESVRKSLKELEKWLFRDIPTSPDEVADEARA